MYFNAIFPLIAILIAEVCQCNGDDVSYCEKIKYKDVGFGQSIGTSNSQVVIGAPKARLSIGYVAVSMRRKIQAPDGQTRFFGEYVDVNEHFIVATGQSPSSIYVFSSNTPYPLLASFPLEYGSDVSDLKISDDDTIFVSVDSGHVLVYRHSPSWYRHQKITLEGKYSNIPLAIYGDCLAVGFAIHGKVNIYRRKNNHFTISHILRSPEGVGGFGINIAMDGNHLAVATLSCGSESIFTYQYDPVTGKWMNNGKLYLPGSQSYIQVSMQNGVLVGGYTLFDQPGLAYVFKLSNTDSTWNKVATLVAEEEKEPYVGVIRVQGNLVYTGNDIESVVYIHDISEI